MWQACEYSVTRNVFFKNKREQIIRDARCLPGIYISKKLPGSKNNNTSYFKTDSQLSKHKVYIEVMWILCSVLTILAGNVHVSHKNPNPHEYYEKSISYFGVDVFSVMVVLCSAGRTAVEDRFTGFRGVANDEIPNWLNFCLSTRDVIYLITRSNVWYLLYLISKIKDVSAVDYSFTKEKKKKSIFFFKAVQNYHVSCQYRS